MIIANNISQSYPRLSINPKTLSFFSLFLGSLSSSNRTMNTSFSMLTQEDFKGLHIDPNLSSFGCLLEVAKVAGEIFDEEISIENKSVAARESITMEDFNGK